MPCGEVTKKTTTKHAQKKEPTRAGGKVRHSLKRKNARRREGREGRARKKMGVLILLATHNYCEGHARLSFGTGESGFVQGGRLFLNSSTKKAHQGTLDNRREKKPSIIVKETRVKGEELFLRPRTGISTRVETSIGYSEGKFFP